MAVSGVTPGVSRATHPTHPRHNNTPPPPLDSDPAAYPGWDRSLLSKLGLTPHPSAHPPVARGASGVSDVSGGERG